ncbi:MAG: response regulator [Roseburia hominis]
MQKNRVMLVADDIDVNRASFRAMFEEEYEVLEAGDGNETLKILEERKVDIVILDMCMPVKSGKQVLKQMKADPKLLDIPVIVKTVIGEERELEMLEMGADDFIFSPCEPEVVKKRVSNIMTRYETLAERLESQRHLSTVREHLLFQVARTVRTDVAVIEECYREMTGQRTENKSVGLEDMYRHLEHIRELTDSVLDGQIVGAGESVCDTFQISDVVAELTSECRTICTEMGIEVTVQEGEIFCEYLVGDVRRLKQIWARLLKKAYINARPGCRIFTGYREVRTGEDELELELAVQGSIDGGEDYPLIKSRRTFARNDVCGSTGGCADSLQGVPAFRNRKSDRTAQKFCGVKDASSGRQ